MKTRLGVLLGLAGSLVLLCPGRASSADLGAAPDAASPACVDYAGNPCVPVACDGALCDTSNGATCALAGRPGSRGAGSPILPAIVLGAVALTALRRRGREEGERV